jgi:hypothetical protein
MPVRGDLLDRRWIIALLSLAAAIPLVWPQIPPLIDLPAHMGRYRIATGIGDIPSLAAAFAFEWKLVGNLGIDLLIVPVSKLFGIEVGTKLIVLAIPVLTVAGMLLTAREVHGRVPPTALFALPLAWPWPLHFGFVNFSLAVGFAWLLLALWLRLGRIDQWGLRAGIFLPLSCLLWLTHMVGWGLLGLAAFGSELVRRSRRGEKPVEAIFRAGLACLPLALPLLPMLASQDVSSGRGTFDWFNFEAKQLWVSSLLRDRWELFDVICGWLLVLIAGVAAIKRRLDPLLGIPALLCVAAFLLMPRVAVGSAYADMRLLPFTVGLALLAIRTPETWARPFAIAGLAFFLLRLGSTTLSLGVYDRAYRDELRAIDHIPRGASVMSLVVRPCGNAWWTERLDHLPSIAIVRRGAFANDQWIIPGASGLTVIKPGVAPFDRDPSQIVYPKHCRSEGSDVDLAPRIFNRAAFDHLWIINGSASLPDLRPIWSNGRSTLYRVVREGRAG